MLVKENGKVFTFTLDSDFTRNAIVYSTQTHFWTINEK